MDQREVPRFLAHPVVCLTRGSLPFGDACSLGRRLCSYRKTSRI